MREILFKGQRVDNGEWIEGALFEGEKFCIIGQEIKFSPYVKNECKIVGFEVIPETVGQYTGLKDKNGVKIFEGDVVKIDFLEQRAEAVWDENNFQYILRNHFTHGFNGFYEHELEVIGNIHDNPELLGGE